MIQAVGCLKSGAGRVIVVVAQVNDLVFEAIGPYLPGPAICRLFPQHQSHPPLPWVLWRAPGTTTAVAVANEREARRVHHHGLVDRVSSGFRSDTPMEEQTEDGTPHPCDRWRLRTHATPMDLQ